MLAHYLYMLRILGHLLETRLLLLDPIHHYIHMSVCDTTPVSVSLSVVCIDFSMIGNYFVFRLLAGESAAS